MADILQGESGIGLYRIGFPILFVINRNAALLGPDAEEF